MPVSPAPRTRHPGPAAGQGGSLVVVALCTVLCWAMFPHVDRSNLIMVYLLGVAFVATRFGRWPGVTAATVSVAAFDFFFVRPYLTFGVEDTQYLITFAVMLIVALLLSGLTVRALELSAAAETARVATETERLRSTLLSSVSHDLRTPLGAIAGAASTLRGHAALDSGARAELAQTIYEEAVRLDRLVANLLDMTRLESGALRPPREWHSLEEIVGSAARRVERQLDGRRLEIDLDPELPLLRLDAPLVEQLLVNLLDNAARYTPRGSTVRLSATAASGEVVVEVSDDGPGLPPGDEERVFEKFYRGSRDRGGSGLGLAICRAVVEAHGGRIRAANLRPTGAAFRFSFPASGTPPGPPEENADER